MTRDARFEALYERHERPIREYCARRVDPAALDDTVAEVFVLAWRKQADLPPDDEVLPWLYGVAYRVVCHEWRRAGRAERLRRRYEAVEVRHDGDPVQGVLTREEHEVVLLAAARLPAADQEILRLTLWEELTLADAAIVLGTTTNAAKQRAHRARKHLIREFRRLTEGPTMIELTPKEGIRP